MHLSKCVLCSLSNFSLGLNNYDIFTLLSTFTFSNPYTNDNHLQNDVGRLFFKYGSRPKVGRGPVNGGSRRVRVNV